MARIVIRVETDEVTVEYTQEDLLADRKDSETNIQSIRVRTTIQPTTRI